MRRYIIHVSGKIKMAAKRALYKPATLEDVGPHERRQGLAQGRLVNKPVLPETMTVYASPRDFNPDVSQTDTGDLTVTLQNSGLPLEGTLTPPRQSLARVGSSNRHLEENSFSQTPREMHVGGHSGSASTAPRSPSKPTPSAFLELSDDAESDPSYNISRSPVQHVRHHTPSPVLYVDASGGHLDPDRSEVETNTDLVLSPAKIICHAPAVVESDLRDTGYTQETARIKVSAVPTVSLLGDLDVTQVKGGKDPTKSAVGVSQGGSRTPLVVKENTVAGLSQDRSDSTKKEDGSRDRNENTPVRSKLESTPKEKKKKTTKVKVVVPSRYMQAATKVASVGSSLMGEQSTVPPRPRLGSASSSRAPAKKPVSKPSSTKRTVSTSSAQQSTLKPSQQQSSRSTNQSQYSCTPMARGMRGVGRVTSTPAVGASIIPPSGSLDASAITSSMVQGPDVSMVMAPASGVTTSLGGRHDSRRSFSPQEKLSAADTSVFPSAMSASVAQDSAYASLPISHKKRHSTDITQDYLDRAYARYTQALFIDSKLEKALKEQEKEAMSQMFGLWHENEKLRNKKQELEMELAQATHANHLDQQLEIQLSGLGPVVAHLDQLQRQYSTLAHALDTTRHQLGTTGIHVPQDEDSYHEMLINALAESENLLGEISAATRTQQPKITSFNNAIQALQTAVENEDKELRRCQELLSATCTLAAQESSLRMQQIET